MNQLKSIYKVPFKDSHSHPVHTCFPINANNAPIFKQEVKVKLFHPIIQNIMTFLQFRSGPFSSSFRKIFSTCVIKISHVNLRNASIISVSIQLGFSRVHDTTFQQQDITVSKLPLFL